VYSAMSVISAPGGLLAGGLGGGGVSRAEPVLLVSDRPVPAKVDAMRFTYTSLSCISSDHIGHCCHAAYPSVTRARLPSRSSEARFDYFFHFVLPRMEEKYNSY